MDFSNIDFLNIHGKKIELTNPDKVRFRPSVYAFVRNSEGKFLFVLNEKSGKWEFPGGGVDLNENISEACIREVKEETGYDVKVVSLQPDFFTQKFSYFYTPDLYMNMLMFYFLVELVDEKQGEQNLMEDEAIVEVKWLSKEEIFELDAKWVHEDAINYLEENFL